MTNLISAQRGQKVKIEEVLGRLQLTVDTRFTAPNPLEVFAVLTDGADASIPGSIVGLPSSGGGRNRQPRLAVLDSAIVDAKRRLVLVRRDNAEHLILIGGPSDVVVETNIIRGSVAPGAQPMDRRSRQQPQELDSLEAALVPEPAYEEPAPRPAPPARMREPAPRAPRPMPPQPQPEPMQDFAEPQQPEPAAFSPPPPLMPRPAPAPAVQPAAAAPAPTPQPAPAQPRTDPQYADMALKLEAALRKPAAAPAPRAPEPAAPAPQAQTRVMTPPPPMPQTRPMPAAPAPATAQPAAPMPSKQEAPNPFDSLEAEMASLLGQDKKR